MDRMDVHRFCPPFMAGDGQLLSCRATIGVDQQLLHRPERVFHHLGWFQSTFLDYI